MTDEQETAAFQGMCGKIGEIWPDYIIVVRARLGRGIREHCSDGNWAHGVVRRMSQEFDARIEHRTRLEVEENR